MIICTTYRRARMLAEAFVLTEHKDCAVLDLGRRKYGVAAKEILTLEQLATAAVIVTVESLRKYIGGGR
ncbi:MAG TPA: hypothetical protein VLM89_07840 [Phycisphaerae bacterium]|nr:hypothetical protein [Phycisphaerae bacterium]